MNKSTLYLSILFFVCSCSLKKKDVVFGDANSQLSIESTNKDLGTLTEGDIVVFEYEFINKGKIEVSILKAIPTCGCITVEIPNKPISPRNKGVVKATFNTEGKIGLQSKKIVVQTNLAYPNDIIELSFNAKVNQK